MEITRKAKEECVPTFMGKQLFTSLVLVEPPTPTPHPPSPHHHTHTHNRSLSIGSIAYGRLTVGNFEYRKK